MTSATFWENVPNLTRDPVFALSLDAKKAPEPKADLVIGAYRDADGRPYPLKVVRKAERRIVTEICPDKEYLPILGFAPFVEEAVKLAYADTLPRSRIVAAQGLSGTGSLSLGGHFLAKVLPRETPVYISDPTWPYQYVLMGAAGLSNTRKYRYYNPVTRGLDFDGLMDDLRGAPERSVFILHACAHNPTGVDPTKEQWAQMAEVFKERRLIAFFDCAYQGFATGSLDNDAYAIRLFVRQGLEILLAQSFAKNMGLYSERAGLFSVVLANEENAQAVKWLLESIVISFYTTPPAHGARVAHLVMSDPELRREWEEELLSMSKRVQEIRQDVFNGLKKRGTPGTWDHIVSQVGMFSYLGLTKAQCERLMKKRVFLLPSGRANMAGLTRSTVGLLVDAIDEVVRT